MDLWASQSEVLLHVHRLWFSAFHSNTPKALPPEKNTYFPSADQSVPPMKLMPRSGPHMWNNSSWAPPSAGTASRRIALNYSTSNSFAVCHFPLVKSGNATGTLPPATDFSDSGEMALLVTES